MLNIIESLNEFPDWKGWSVCHGQESKSWSIHLEGGESFSHKIQPIANDMDHVAHVGSTFIHEPPGYSHYRGHRIWCFWSSTFKKSSDALLSPYVRDSNEFNLCTTVFRAMVCVQNEVCGRFRVGLEFLIWVVLCIDSSWKEMEVF